MKKTIRRISAVLAACLLLAMAGCSTSGGDTIKIAHKNYTEQRITGQLMAVYLESKGFKTKVSELAGTMLCFNALKSGDVDVYAEFTGTGYGTILKQTDILGVDETYDYVKKHFEEEFGITWLSTLGWNNTYVLSVTPETAAEYNLTKISDLVPISSNMVLGSDAEFSNRTDGLTSLETTYTGLKFKETKSMDQGLTYQALVDGNLDVNVSYSTDGRISKFGLVNLEDDQSCFPPYYVTPILKLDYAEKNPEVVAALEELANQWTAEEMQKYNLMADEGATPKDVATLMLRDKGLID